MKIMLIGGDATHNRGDRAILAGNLRLVRETLPVSEITIVSQMPDRDAGWYGVRAIPRRRAAILSAAARVDLVLWTGGVLLQDDSSRAKIPYWWSLVRGIERRCPNIVGWCQGVGPVETRLGRLLARKAAESTRCFVTRDRRALETLRAIGYGGPSRACIDPAIMARPEGPAAGPPMPDGPVVGIAPRRWFHLNRALLGRAIQYRLGLNRMTVVPGSRFDRLLTSLAAAADHAVEEYDATVAFVPMYDLPHEDDTRVGELVRERMRNPARTITVRHDGPPAEHMAIISRLDMMVGIRLHSTILAAASGVPPLTVYYTSKGLGFFEQLGLPELALPVDSVAEAGGQDRLVAKMDAVWSDRDAIRLKIAERIAARREELRETLRWAVGVTGVSDRVPERTAVRSVS